MATDSKGWLQQQKRQELSQAPASDEDDEGGNVTPRQMFISDS